MKTLVNKYQKSNHYKITWNGKSNRGKEVASGVYFYRLKAGDYIKSMKMVLLR